MFFCYFAQSLRKNDKRHNIEKPSEHNEYKQKKNNNYKVNKR